MINQNKNYIYSLVFVINPLEIWLNNISIKYVITL